MTTVRNGCVGVFLIKPVAFGSSLRAWVKQAFKSPQHLSVGCRVLWPWPGAMAETAMVPKAPAKYSGPTEMSRRILASLSSVLDGRRVSKNYDIAYFIAGHVYHLQSKAGALKVVSFSDEESIARLMKESKCQVHLPKTELGLHNMAARSTFGELHWMTARSGKIFVGGESQQFDDLHTELSTAETPIDIAIKTANQMDPPSQYAQEDKEVKNSGSTWGLDPILETELRSYFQSFVKLSVSQGIYFSAVSTMQGNFAQANYCAANSFLDNLAMWQRMTHTWNFKSTSMMWGMVGGIGMRLKAFGSNDVIAQSAAELVMTLDEAKMGLMAMICQQAPPQWMGCTFMGGTSTSPLAEPLPDVASALPSSQKGGVMGVADDGYQGGADELTEQIAITYKAEPKEKPTPVKAEKAAMPKKPSPSHKPEQEYYIAGSWDDWTKHDMKWDASRATFFFQVKVGANAEKFCICKGKANGKIRLLSRGQSYAIKNGEDCYYEIRLCLGTSGASPKVEWEKFTAPPPATTPEKENMQAEAETTDAGTDGASSDSGSDASDPRPGTAATDAPKPSMLLVKLLDSAMPDWSDASRDEAVAKLYAAGVATVPKLLASLRGKGGHSLNSKLKAVGGKPFSSETLDALRRETDALTELVAAVSPQ